METSLLRKNTQLTDSNIDLLKKMFGKETEYIEYMETLWILRDLSLSQIRNEDDTVNQESPNFRIAKLTNEMIGALFQPGYNFNLEQIKQKYDKGK